MVHLLPGRLLASVVAAIAVVAAIPDPSSYGDQDLWVYTAQWLPQVCNEKSVRDSAVCKHLSKSQFQTTHFVAENLVPTYTDGSAQFGMCRYEYGTFLPSNIVAGGGANTLKQYWPYLNPAAKWGHLWDGEIGGTSTPQYNWTCGGMHQADYLRNVTALTTGITPSFVSQHIGETVETAAVRAAFKATHNVDVVLRCDDSTKLARVLVCLDKAKPSATSSDPTYEPTTAIPCPNAIQSHDSCSGHEVSIVGVGGRSFVSV
ncbi:unnamed protein product [Aphanomyces euteiches]|uniref:SCP domain-containing protein n=1 Tax=Aphanomyces euteiches TaxID=100861 RepID=A0A6G0X8M6_9STRA|nr:hypothetical protein Ae201684_007323 [Aphanomyces euteiches]KAH9101014.1 hypothetical protein Ae201684P_007203 [Aphanomyces euteiches]